MWNERTQQQQQYTNSIKGWEKNNNTQIFDSWPIYSKCDSELEKLSIYAYQDKYIWSPLSEENGKKLQLHT